MSLWRLPNAVEQALWTAAEAELSPAALVGKRLREAVIQRSRIYTSERERLPESPAGEADLAARALFFTAADAPKIMVPLAELAAAGRLPTSDPLRIVDLGAGVGAMTLGAWAFLRARGDQRAVTVRAVDRDAAALALMRRAGAALGIDVDTDAQNLVAPPAPGSADLVFIGSTLNELSTDAARGVVATAVKAVGDGGAVIIVEPALRTTARALHQLRDWVIDSELARVFAPCSRRATPCPALADADDWCHEDRPTALPERASQIANATGLRQHGMKFAYLTLVGDAATMAPDPGPERVALRVVSQPRKLKGRRELYACGDSGRRLVRLLKRNRSPANRAFDSARRGDLLVSPDVVDVGNGDRVDRIAVKPDDD